MQTNRKAIGIMLILIGLMMIAAIVYFFFIKKTATNLSPTASTDAGGQLPSAAVETGTTTPSDRPRDNGRYDISKETPRAVDAAALAQRAGSYAERFGSYSTQSDYGNFTDLKLYMTADMQAWVDKYVEEQKASAKSGSYYGIITTALTTEVKSFDDKLGIARITVLTDRRESTTNIGGGTPFRQTLGFDFLKVGGEWLIDKAYWEKNN